MTLVRALEHVQHHISRYRRWLEDFLRIPSISTDPAYASEVRRAAEWLARRLRNDLKARVMLWETEKHPVLFGEIPGPSGAPTVLMYGHYDVQPPGEAEAWSSMPFEPVVIGDRLYARGAADMKAQIIALLAAVDAAREAGLPLNVKFLLEGEEEIGSPSLPQVLKDHAEAVRADICLNPDAGMQGPDLPTITYGLRGLALFQLEVYGPKEELHSGLYGGAIPNPIQAAMRVLGRMHDDQGRVTVPGFYDAVRPLAPEERELLARLPFPREEDVQSRFGIPGYWGEVGYTPLERTVARPTLEFHGIVGGYVGTGSKTIVPSSVTIKFSCRLVPDQDPDEVHRQIRAYLEAHMPPYVRWELHYGVGAPPVLLPWDTPAVQILRQALQETWGVEPLLARSGGTIPAVAFLQQYAGVTSLLTGFALPDSRAHGPNENQHLPTWEKGIQAVVRFLYGFRG